jgi:hypothetical protein
MCCFITSFILLGPRFAILVWWLIDPLRFSLTFRTFMVPVILAIFAPFTMLMYVALWLPGMGIYGFDWLWLGLAIAADVFSYVGGGYGNRKRLAV